MKKKIAFCINSLGRGGAERVILNLLKYFKSQNYDVILVTSRVAEEEYELPSDVKRYVTDESKKNTFIGRIAHIFFRNKFFKNIWRDERPDYIISFIGKMNIFSLMTAKKFKIPVYVSVRNDPKTEYATLSMQLLMKHYFKFAKKIILQTQEAKEYFDNRFLGKTIVLPNSLSEQFLKERYQGTRKNEIVTVGRVDKQKNQALLIHVFAEIHKKYDNTVLRIYGGYSSSEAIKDELEVLCKTLNVTDCVFFEGRQTQLEEKIYKAKVFVLPSDFEGMPNALLEAMALGLPVISTDCPCGGPREIIQDGENGLLIPVGDKDALVKALDRILSEDDFANKLGMNAAKIQEQLNPLKVNKMWQDMIENKRVVFYLGSLAKGGAERVITNLAEFFNRQNWEVTIVTKEKADEEYEISDQIKRVIADIEGDEISGSRIKNLSRRIKKLRRILNEINPDIVVSFIGKNNFMAIRAAKKLGIPVVVSVRSTPSREYKSKSMSLLVNPMFKKASGVVLQTQEAKTYFKPAVQGKAVVLPNSLNPNFIKSLYEGARRKRIVTVGRLDDNKNQILLIWAFEKVADDFPEWELYLYGDGPSRKKWEEYVQNSSCATRIHFMGMTDEIYNKIDMDSVFVLPSIMEGMPNALIEAMALGLACVSTDCPCGGPKELLGNDENGLLVPVNDVDAMSKALSKLLSDDMLVKKYSEKAYEKVQEFQPKKVNHMWEEYLLQVIADANK